MAMPNTPDTPIKRPKAPVLGRSALTGLNVLAPVVTKKSKISDKQIEAAVASVIANRK